MTYIEKLKDPRWQKKRLKILERDSFTCVHCGDEKTTLNVHHKKYTGEPWEAPTHDLETVCEDCHLVVDQIKGIKSSDLSLIKIIKDKHEKDDCYWYIICDGVLGVISYRDGDINTIAINDQKLNKILKIMNNG